MVKEAQLSMTAGSTRTRVGEDFEKNKVQEKMLSIFGLSLILQGRLGGRGDSPGHRQALVSSQGKGRGTCREGVKLEWASDTGRLRDM